MLGMTEEMNAKVEEALLEKNEVMRPGYTRLSLPYYLSDACVSYVLMAVEFVAVWGPLFMSEYR